MFNDVTQPLFWLHIVQYGTCADQRDNTAACSPPLSEPAQYSSFPAYGHSRKAFSDVVVDFHPAITAVHVQCIPLFSRYANALLVSVVTRQCFHPSPYPAISDCISGAALAFLAARSLFCWNGTAPLPRWHTVHRDAAGLPWWCGRSACTSPNSLRA